MQQQAQLMQTGRMQMVQRPMMGRLGPMMDRMMYAQTSADADAETQTEGHRINVLDDKSDHSELY